MPSINSIDFELVAVTQLRFALLGWRWTEETFDNGDVSLRFTLSRDKHAFSDPEQFEARKYGWGRFPRLTAWIMAKDFLLDEISDSTNDLEGLRIYKMTYQPDGCPSTIC